MTHIYGNRSDASAEGLDAVLAQEGEDETLHPVAYASVLCKLHEEQT